MTTHFTKIATPNNPFYFQNGSILKSITIAWKTWGQLSPKRDNVILLFPVLTTSHHATGFDGEGPGVKWWTSDCYHGWWNDFIGPGKALDTNKWWILCPSFLGSCYGSTGPSSIDPETGQVWGYRFPFPEISDLVDAKIRLLDRLGIDHVHGVVGASFGGYLALDLALRYPNKSRKIVSIASGLRVTNTMKLANLQQVIAIESSLNCQLNRSSSLDDGCQGLALARMIAMQQYIVAEEVDTYCSQRVDKSLKEYGSFPIKDPVESWLLYQGKVFSKRFDPHSYLRLLHAWQTWNTEIEKSSLEALKILKTCQQQQWLIFSIDSDRCFPALEQSLLAKTLKTNHISTRLVNLSSRLGHDSFMREPDLYQREIQDFLALVDGGMNPFPKNGSLLHNS